MNSIYLFIFELWFNTKECDSAKCNSISGNILIPENKFRIPASTRHSRPGLATSSLNCKRRAGLTRWGRRRWWRGSTWTCRVWNLALLRTASWAVSPFPCPCHMVPPCIHSSAAPKLALKRRIFSFSKVLIWQTSGFTNLWIKICYAAGSEGATKSKREDTRLALSRTTLRDEFRIDLCLGGTKWWYNSRFPI